MATAAPTQEPGFQKPDLSSMPIIQQMSPQDRDAYQRVAAAGMKLMYAPATREELQQGIQSKDPIPKKLAENVTGLMLILDQKTKGGIPSAAIFPAAIDLMGEAADVLTKAGQPVSQGDFHDASLMLFTMIGKKLGATDQQLMQAAEQAIPAGDSSAAPAQPQGPQIGMLGSAGGAS